ncbi:amidoligase family protein [Ruminococcus albus]|uniref:amidoligase family protein n=1 Tax=Ruminococcus albus TaxID=1264 RepID=UPI003D6D7E79
MVWVGRRKIGLDFGIKVVNQQHHFYPRGGETIVGNFDGIKIRRFVVEIEMTGITRCAAAKAIQKVLGGSIYARKNRLVCN